MAKRKSAGLIEIRLNKNWYVHIFVRPGHWFWGHEVEAYDLCADYWGCGPLFLVVRGN